MPRIVTEQVRPLSSPRYSLTPDSVVVSGFVPEGYSLSSTPVPSNRRYRPHFRLHSMRHHGNVLPAERRRPGRRWKHTAQEGEPHEHQRLGQVTPTNHHHGTGRRTPWAPAAGAELDTRVWQVKIYDNDRGRLGLPARDQLTRERSTWTGVTELDRARGNDAHGSADGDHDGWWKMLRGRASQDHRHSLA